MPWPGLAINQALVIHHSAMKKGQKGRKEITKNCCYFSCLAGGLKDRVNIFRVVPLFEIFWLIIFQTAMKKEQKCWKYVKK